MKIFKFIVPNILIKLDNWLLKNKPNLWSTKLHWVLWYSLIFILFNTILACITPINFLNKSTAEYWAVFVSILSFIAFILWLIYLLQFNVFKRFGIFSASNNLQSFIAYFICIVCFVVYPFIYSIVEVVRVNRAYQSSELISDINKINYNIAWLEYDSLPHNWQNDTVLVVPNLYDENLIQDDSSQKWITQFKYNVIDTSTFNYRKQDTDSIISLGNNVYVIIDCPQYLTLQVYYTNKEERSKLLSNQSLYQLIFKNYKSPPKDSLQSELKNIYNKYNSNFSLNYERNSKIDELNLTDSLLTRGEIFAKYNLYKLETGLENIFRKKNKWDDESRNDAYRVILYTALILSLFVLVYRNTTIKTFFLSILVGLLLTIISSFFVALFDIESYSVFAFYFFYLVVFMLIAFSVFFQKQRSVVTGIAINIFTLIVAFVPIVVVWFYYERVKFNNINLYYTNNLDYTTMHLHFFYAEVLTFSLILLLIPTLIYKMYKRWYALPEN